MFENEYKEEAKLCQSKSLHALLWAFGAAAFGLMIYRALPRVFGVKSERIPLQAWGFAVAGAALCILIFLLSWKAIRSRFGLLKAISVIAVSCPLFILFSELVEYSYYLLTMRMLDDMLLTTAIRYSSQVYFVFYFMKVCLWMFSTVIALYPAGKLTDMQIIAMRRSGLLRR